MGAYTALSDAAFHALLQNKLAPSETVAYFVNCIPKRTFRDILSAAYQGGDMKNRLVDGLFAFKTAFHGIYLSQDAKAKPPARDTIRRNVSNWMDGRTVPSKRLDVIGACFALGLDVNVADDFLRQASGCGFHMREPLEIALFYCLHTQKGIPESAALIRGLDLSFSAPAPGEEAKVKTTEIVEGEFWSRVRSEEDLVEFLDENRPSFSKMHNYAFERFKYYYSAVAASEKSGDSPAKTGETPYMERQSVGRVVADRLRFGVPLAENLQGYSEYQKAIRESWLGETSVKRILERKEDVTRKALLLLYIAASGAGQSTYLTREMIDGEIYNNIHSAYSGILDDAGSEFDEWDACDDLTPQQSLREHTTRLDLVLTDCGFARLDPRAPFDWLVMYSLCVNEADYNEEQRHECGLMSERLEQVLGLLFSETDGNEPHDD